MSEKKKNGFGILDWIDGSFFLRLLRVVSPIAIVLAVVAFMFQLDDMKADRDARAWATLARDTHGNSGKVEALNYLNSHHPLFIPNPRRWTVFGWTIPLGPKATSKSGEPPGE